MGVADGMNARRRKRDRDVFNPVQTGLSMTAAR
jgi:hypothetical protein